MVSENPVAVIAQQWDEPKMLRLYREPDHPDDLLKYRGRLVFHANYHGQIDPDTVHEELSELRSPNIADDPRESKAIQDAQDEHKAGGMPG